MGRQRFALCPLTMAAAVVAASLLIAPRAKAEPARMDPAATKVVVLPVLERSGRKGDERDEFVKLSGDVLRADLDRAGFAVLDQDLTDAGRELQVDFNDDEQRNRANYRRLAHKLGARLVIAATIRDVASGVRVNVFSSQKAGKARVEFAVYDADADRFVVKDIYTGDKRGMIFAPALDKSSSKRSGALAAAIHAAVRDFLHQAGIEPPGDRQ